MTESEIKKQICEYLEALGCRPRVIQSVGIAGRKNNSRFACKGIPDVFGSIKGAPLWIEIKKPGGKVSPEQKEFIEWAIDQGWVAFVARSLSDVVVQLEVYRLKGKINP